MKRPFSLGDGVEFKLSSECYVDPIMVLSVMLDTWRSLTTVVTGAAAETPSHESFEAFYRTMNTSLGLWNESSLLMMLLSLLFLA